MSEVDNENYETSGLSALDHNIKQKGNNAYYYAHSLKLDGPQWDGKEEPRLLKVGPSPQVSVKQIVTEFQSYSWADGDDKKVKIYVEYDNANSIDASQISLVSKTMISICLMDDLKMSHATIASHSYNL